MKRLIYKVLGVVIIGGILLAVTLFYYKTPKDTVKNTITNVVTKKETSNTPNKPKSVEKSIAEIKAEKDANVVQDRPLYPKEVFLTFDDGPSTNNTLKDLKILNDNNIKATFFEIGKNAEEHPDIVKQLNDSGMSIENHSYTHDYKMYNSVKECFDDFNKSRSIIEGIIGRKLSHFMRFPGGSDNQVSNSNTMNEIRHEAVKEGFYFVDWYPSSSDAAPGGISAEQIYENVTTRCKGMQLAVVLMHDAPEKATSTEALPRIIDNLKQQGFVFRSFNDITPTEINKMIKIGIIDRGIK